MSKWIGLFRQRCPRCLKGKIFAGRIDMHRACPECGLVFEREPGYFMGAMYISYPIAACFLGLFMFLFYLLFPALGLGWLLILAMIAFVPLVPMVFRYSRTIWIYFDRLAWPAREDSQD